MTGAHQKAHCCYLIKQRNGKNDHNKKGSDNAALFYTNSENSGLTANHALSVLSVANDLNMMW